MIEDIKEKIHENGEKIEEVKTQVDDNGARLDMMPVKYVELQGGDGIRTGNVFVVNNNRFFGPVCDDLWTDTDATTVCRSGYTNSI